MSERPPDEHYTLGVVHEDLGNDIPIVEPGTHLWLGELFVGDAPDRVLCWKADPSKVITGTYALSVDSRKECVTCQDCLELIHS